MILLAAIAALVAAGVLYQALGARRARRRFPPPGALVDVGGHRLHAHCMGEGGPIVLLESGIAASSLSWTLVQPRIAAFTRACAYDRAGLAWSDPPSCPRTFDRIVDELAAVLGHVAPGGRPVLVGHSFGCFVVCAYARRHPDDVAGVVLVDPAVEWLTATPQRARLLRGARQLSRVGALLARAGVVRASLALLTGGAPGAPRRFVRVFGPTAARTLERLIGEVRKLPPAVYPALQALWCQPKCFHAMADHLLVLERHASSIAASLAPAAVPMPTVPMATVPMPTVPMPTVPMTVISGGDQPADHLAAHRRLAEASVNGRHVIAARSAHWVQFDEPELIVEAVRDMVELARRAD